MKYTPKIPLWDTQKKGLAKMRGHEAFALTMSMRTGKTATTLTDFGQLELDGKVQDLLIIAPGGVYRTWLPAMEMYLSTDLWGRIHTHVWSSNMGTNDRRRLQSFLAERDGPRALLVNIEALSRPGEARETVKKFVGQRICYVAIDESSRIKNKSKRTDFVINNIAPKAGYRRILSGLPTPRSPLDLFYQFYFLDWSILGHKSWYTFRASIAHLRVEYLGSRSVIVVDKQKGDNGFRSEALKELQRRIAPYSYRVEFRPKVPSTYTVREVEMTKEQAKAYKEIKEFATTKLENDAHVTATVVIAQMMRMHQVLCGHVGDEEGNTHLIPENKTEALMELLDDIDGKVVIWFSYLIDLHRVRAVIEKEYGPGSTAEFSGTNLKTREADEARFKSDPICRFILGTPDAGGMGRNWSNAKTCIYYSSKDNLEHREQSEQRVHARDKEDGVDYIDIIHRNTVEEKILHALRNKINMSSAINGDNYKSWII